MNAAVFHALGDPTRLEIVARLSAAGSLPLGKLTEGLAMSRQAAAKHVQVLRSSGLVVVEDRGRQALCSLQPEQLRQAELWIAGLAAQWDGRLEALRVFVED